MKILEIKNLNKIYHDKSSEISALNNVSFDLYDNEILAVVGPSGCGKSTILSILTNLIDKSSGEIKFNKDNIVLGYMLQSDSLFPWKNVLDNCMLGLKIKGEDTEENKNKVIKLLETYGLEDFIYKYPTSLSGGMRQRVGCIL